MSTDASGIDAALPEALGYFNAGDLARARSLCERALLPQPLQPGLLQMLGLICLQQDQAAQALRCATSSLALRPDHGPTQLLAGDAARACGDVDAALSHHLRASRSMPQRSDAAVALGLSLQAAGRLAEAEVALSTAVRLSPAAVPAWFALGQVRQDLGRLAGAEEALRQLRKIAPPRAEVELNLAIVLQEAGRLDEAIQLYASAWRLNPATFGRIAHSLANARSGRMWLDREALRETLRRQPA